MSEMSDLTRALNNMPGDLQHVLSQDRMARDAQLDRLQEMLDKHALQVANPIIVTSSTSEPLLQCLECLGTGIKPQGVETSRKCMDCEGHGTVSRAKFEQQLAALPKDPNPRFYQNAEPAPPPVVCDVKSKRPPPQRG